MEDDALLNPFAMQPHIINPLRLHSIENQRRQLSNKNSTRQPRGVVDLHQAIRAKDCETVRRLVSCGVDINAPVRGVYPLSLALCVGLEDAVNVLLEHNANVNRMSRDHNDRLEPPLFTACRLGSEAMVRRILSVGTADVNKTDFYNQSPLWIATRERRLDLVDLLLDSGARVNVARTWSECPLYLATKYLGYARRRDIAKQLVRHGIRVNVADNKDRTPLYWALKNCDREVSRMLVACGARVGSLTWSQLDQELDRELKEDASFYGWLRDEMVTPPPLQRMCVHMIRQHVASVSAGNFVENLKSLPLPRALVRYAVEDSFPSFDDG